MIVANANVVDVVGGEVRRNSAIKIDSAGSITQIGNSTSVKSDAREEVIDLEAGFCSQD